MWVRDTFGPQAAVHRSPRLTGIVSPECASGRDGDEEPLWMARVQHDRVQAHPTGARLPQMPLRATQFGKLLPGLPAVGRVEQGGIFYPSVDCIWIGQRRFEMPDALELPGTWCAIIPLMRAGDA